ncbi:MAG: hypothetical protein V3T72_22835, partial [Thermoanaerobaculia bacterium]
GKYTSVTIGTDGFGLISYFDDSNDNLKVAHCSNVVCTSATISTLDFFSDVGRFNSLTLGADGLGLISYFQRNGATIFLKVARCGNVQCTSVAASFLDSASGVGSSETLTTSIALGVDGRGLISYSDGSRLKTAHCLSSPCTAAAIATLDNSATRTGMDNSLEIGPDGRGVISYFSVGGVGTERLRVARCRDVDCASATFATFDASLVVGTQTSMTIGADGFPLFSYHQFGNNDLKVVHCSNRFCLPFVR